MEVDFAKNKGDKAIVCVTDTGAKLTHPDIDWRGNQFAFDGTGTGVDDRHGHSHSVCGLIGAKPNNNTGLVGIASDALIVPYKCLEGGSGQWDWFSACLRQFADAEFPGHEGKIKIVNASLGGAEAPSTVFDAVKYAVNKGVIIVASAGNPGNNNPVKYPGKYKDWVITVGAVDKNDLPAYFTAQGEEVDLANYGVKVYTHDNKGGYWFVSGTSFSSPLTAGIVALIVSEHYEFFSNLEGKERRDAVEKYLTRLAEDVHEDYYDLLTGYGVPRLRKLIESDPKTILEAPDEPIGVPRPKLRSPFNNGTSISKKVTFRWYQVLMSSYTLEISRDYDFTDILATISLDSYSYTYTLPDYGTYYWRVKATRNGEDSQWSTRWGVTVNPLEEKLSAPQLIAPVNNHIEVGKRLEFEWGLVEGATQYKLRISDDPNFLGSAFGYTGASLKKLVTVPELNTKYYWKVLSIGDKPGTWSEVREFETSSTPPPEDPGTYPERLHHILIEGPFNIIYGENDGSEIVRRANGVALVNNLSNKNESLKVTNIKVEVRSKESFGVIYEKVEQEVNAFFYQRGLIIENPDAKAAHDSTIMFINLLIKDKIPTFKVTSIESDSDKRLQY